MPRCALVFWTSLALCLGLQLLHMFTPTTERGLVEKQSKRYGMNVFYHVFVPKYPEHAMDIIQEQLAQVGRFSNDTGTIRVFYNTIGNSLHPRFYENICEKNHLECHHLEHFGEGFEDLTLTSLYDFCKANPNESVVYMHSKGSYHPKAYNNRWRQGMTAASTSKQCQDSLVGGSGSVKGNFICDTCGLYFDPTRSPFYPGNIWSARCSYVNKLLPPVEFHDKTIEVVKEALLMQARNMLITTIMPPRSDTLGIDRYTSEMWVGSHPSLRPCSVGNESEHIRYYRKNSITDDAVFSLHAFSGSIMNDTVYGFNVSQDEKLRLREYFLLPGHILRWMYLYNEIPPEDSYIWDYFPDSEKWKDATRIHGANAVNEMTKFARR